jgi:hypothetical protein
MFCTLSLIWDKYEEILRRERERGWGGGGEEGEKKKRQGTFLKKLTGAFLRC